MAGKLALKRLRRAQVREQQQAAPTQDRLVIRMLGAAGAACTACWTGRCWWCLPNHVPP
jgi:hypothetical protein